MKFNARKALFNAGLFFFPFLLATTVVAQPAIDKAELLGHVRFLSSDELEGRRTGENGIRQARYYIIGVMDEAGVEKLDGRYTHSFKFTAGAQQQEFRGTNVMTYIKGTKNPDLYIVMSAHYDHLGTRDGVIYNGADDNASGVAVMLEAARYFAKNPPEHSIIFVAFDAEEMGLRGAREFVDNPPVPLDQIVLNINMDMVSRSVFNEIYAAGTHHYLYLKPILEKVKRPSGIRLKFGHDSPDLKPHDNWTLSSDHGPFHMKDIPFVYFGVEDHDGYHNPSDDFENITPDFFHKAAQLIVQSAIDLDANLGKIKTELDKQRGK